MHINKFQQTWSSTMFGASLVEFMISIVISLFSISLIISMYLSSMISDNKTMQLTRLQEEINTLITIISDDIARAGLIKTAHEYVAGSIIGCHLHNCSPSTFRTVVIDRFDRNETNYSCISYTYDHDRLSLPSDDNAMGYRLHNGSIEVRVGGRTCQTAGWTDITDKRFVYINKLSFTMLEPARSANCTVNNTTMTCIGNKTANNIEIHLIATLISPKCKSKKSVNDKNCVRLSSTKKVVLNNASYL